MVIRFQEEKFSEVFDEAVPLLQRHWEEIARDRDRIPLAPNVPGYIVAEERGALCICTARDGDRMIGYSCYLVGPADHYSTTVFAESDIFWMDPEFRNFTLGRQLFGFTEERLKLRGVVVMHTRAKIHAAPGASALLQKMGHAPVETVFRKVIG